METAVVVPVKRLDLAKQRLGPDVTPDTRARLARWMAERVVAACAPMQVVVVCDDDDVAAWADSVGARIHHTVAAGLDAAVEAGVAHVADLGFEHVVVAHADLPLPATIPDVPRAGTITLVPDQRRDGTNVMSFPLAHRLSVAYGPGSFSRHLTAARRLATAAAVELEVRPDPDLALDVDTPDDLRHPRLRRSLPTWLPTTLDNPFTP